MRWWTDLVDKTPEVEGVQRRKSELGRIMILRISETVVGANKKCWKFFFQDIVGGWIKSSITNEWVDGIDDILGIGRNFGLVGIQGEDQMGRLEWIWGIKQAPIDRRGNVALIPFKILEPNEREEDKKLPYLIYFVWKREAHKLSWLERSFHPSLEIRDRLASFISRKPRPPWSLGKHKDFQDFSDKLRTLSLGKSHQKFLKALSNWLQRPFGSIKELIA
jgi:hypothetical protein